MRPLANILAIPHKVSRVLTVGLLSGGAVLMAVLIYQRHVLGNPM